MRRSTATLLLLALTWLAPVAPALAQRADGLDQPLLALNRCGPGDGETHFTLVATGDTFPHENIQAVGEAQGYAVLFDEVRPFLQAADLAYTNFDGAMLAGAGYTGYPNFNFNPALATALRGAGIGLVSTANNHILDRGPEGIDATLGVLDASGMLHHGAVRSTAVERPPFLPLTLSHDGASITLGFISATWGTNGISDPLNQVNLLYESNNYSSQGGVRQSVLDAVAQAAAATDLVIVAAHWGFEYEFYPHTSQLEAARRLAEAGADIILGAQPHTLQPVEVIEHDGQQTLVIYSLANFIASQGAFQAQAYAATSVIFYIGLARSTDGAVRVTGYRYLPTMHIAGDTRPAPLQPGTADDVIAHVRTMMRDPEGLRQLPATPPSAGRVEVCPSLVLAEAPTTPIPGDFAQHYTTLGGRTPRPLSEAISVLGLPLGAPVREPSGDCATPVPVFYTERQRLELHPNEPWPYRVVGTQLGTHAFMQRYPGRAPEPRTALDDPTAFADSRFRTFYEQYGGLAIFGYPISGALNEDHPETHVPTTVQYFERARFELAPTAPPGAPLNEQVHLGLLGRELRQAGGAAALCGGQLAAANEVSTPSALAVTSSPEPGLLPALSGEDLALISAAATQLAQSVNPWLPYLAFAALAVTLLALAGFAFADWRGYHRRRTRRGYRHRRSAYERFARVPTSNVDQAARIRAMKPVEPGEQQPVPRPRTTDDEDDLLRSLLDQQ